VGSQRAIGGGGGPPWGSFLHSGGGGGSSKIGIWGSCKRFVAVSALSLLFSKLQSLERTA